jgi:hypothetical protein
MMEDRRQMDLSRSVLRRQRPGDGQPDAADRWAKRHPGWSTIARWGSLPAIACLLAGLGLAAGSDRSPGSAARADPVPPLGSWSGYTISGGPYHKAGATFTVPTATCPQSGSGSSGSYTVYKAGLQGTGAIVQAGFEITCNVGQPGYWGWTSTAAGTSGIMTTVSPGDQLAVAISCLGTGACSEGLQDVTQNWNKIYTLSVPNGFTANVAAVAAESGNGGVASGPVQVTGATVDNAPIGTYNPQPNEQDPNLYGGKTALIPSALDSTGMDFAIIDSSFEVETGQPGPNLTDSPVETGQPGPGPADSPVETGQPGPGPSGPGPSPGPSGG